MYRHDMSMYTMFGGVLAFAANWYVFENSVLVRRIMTLVPLLASIIILAIEICGGGQ
jgi:multidrug transporter EmrE-like cation transporter